MADPVQVTPPPEPQAPFVRTYAKDAAALGGDTAVKTPTPAPQKAPLPKPEKKPEPELPPGNVIPKAPTTNESRESVLARLRAKVGGEKPTPVSKPSPRDAILTRLKTKAAAPPPPPVPVPPAPKAGPSPIHTYKSDFSDKTKRSGASRISILAAQQDASATPAPTVLKKKPTSAYVFVAGAVLMILGVGSVFLAYQLVTGKPAITFEPPVPSLIFADKRAQVAGAGTELQDALVALESTPLAEGEILVAYVTYASTTPKGDTVDVPASGGTLIGALALPAPDIVLRNIEPASTVGIVHAEGESSPFFILKVSSFERTFAGMLSWEATVADDLARLYPPYPVPVLETATSTDAVFAAIPRFVDEVVENRNVRILRDMEGRTVLLYGYRDKSTLVIVRNEAAFREILKRLNNTR